MKIYIGNMSSDTTEDQIRQAFKAFGEVTTINIITDKHNNKPKGFAFVEMSEKKSAMAAISGLNGQMMNGRKLNVNEAKQKIESGNRDGGNKYRKIY